MNTWTPGSLGISQFYMNGLGNCHPEPTSLEKSSNLLEQGGKLIWQSSKLLRQLYTSCVLDFTRFCTCTGATHTFKHIYSLPLVHRPISVSLAFITGNVNWNTNTPQFMCLFVKSFVISSHNNCFHKLLLGESFRNIRECFEKFW